MRAPVQVERTVDRPRATTRLRAAHRGRLLERSGGSEPHRFRVSRSTADRRKSGVSLRLQARLSAADDGVHTASRRTLLAPPAREASGSRREFFRPLSTCPGVAMSCPPLRSRWSVPAAALLVVLLAP